jgi:hypothetical protein
MYRLTTSTFRGYASKTYGFSVRCIQNADVTAPIATAFTPLDNATSIARTTNLEITFSEPVNVGSGTITIKKSSDNTTVETINVTSGQITGQGTSTITILPSTSLEDVTSYYVQISASAFADAAGNGYAGTVDTTSWNFTTSDATAPSVSIVSIIADSTAQLTISVTSTDSGIGLHETPFWFNETSHNTGSVSSTDWQASEQFINAGLAANTEYSYQVKARDAGLYMSAYSNEVSKYTKAPAPTGIVASGSIGHADISANSLPNEASGLSGYYFSRDGANSGWIQTNSWRDANPACDIEYVYSVKYRNGDGVETAFISSAPHTVQCFGGGGFSSRGTSETKPTVKTEEVTSTEPKADTSESSTVIVIVPELTVTKSETSIQTPALVGTFRMYATNTQTVQLQNFLKETGFFPATVQSTGYYGTITQKAVQKFQCKQNIVCKGTPTSTGYGIVGPKTRAAINTSTQ